MNLDTINDLERRIVCAEDDADAMLWEQARQVVELKDEKEYSYRDIARYWIDVRTGLPYSPQHVYFTIRTYSVKHALQPRPRFRDAYNEIAHAAKRRPPKDPEPFCIGAAYDHLETVVIDLTNTWPNEVRPLIPDLLRTLADVLERDHDDRGERVDRAGSDTDPALVRHLAVTPRRRDKTGPLSRVRGAA